jgi:hypothetical protein
LCVGEAPPAEASTTGVVPGWFSECGLLPAPPAPFVLASSGSLRACDVDPIVPAELQPAVAPTTPVIVRHRLNLRRAAVGVLLFKDISPVTAVGETL